MANHAVAANVYVSFLEKKGMLSWLYTTDHKRIGILYLVSISLFFLIAGVIALLMRFELLTPASDFVSPHTYNVLFTLHGSIMVFFFRCTGACGKFRQFPYSPHDRSARRCVSEAQHRKLLALFAWDINIAFCPPSTC